MLFHVSKPRKREREREIPHRSIVFLCVHLSSNGFVVWFSCMYTYLVGFSCILSFATSSVMHRPMQRRAVQSSPVTPSAVTSSPVPFQCYLQYSAVHISHAPYSPVQCHWRAPGARVLGAGCPGERCRRKNERRPKLSGFNRIHRFIR